MYWISFSDRPSACIVCNSEHIKNVAECFGVVSSITTLPYPANPVIFRHGERIECPAFCSSPEKCKGNLSCRKSFSCTN